MLATMTLVICLKAAPAMCELKEVRVDAQACFYGGRNVAMAQVPESHELRSARCVPAFHPSARPRA